MARNRRKYYYISTYYYIFTLIELKYIVGDIHLFQSKKGFLSDS
jgi:hypothetical protein